MTQLPDIHKLYEVTDKTWPAARKVVQAPFTLRQGNGGGSRVSAATVAGDFTPEDIAAAASAMRDIGQLPLFMVRDGETMLDLMLENMGYQVKDPVVLYAARIDDVAIDRPPHKTVFTVWPPLAVQCEIWAHGGIGANRMAVMNRAEVPKTTLLGRSNDDPAGTCYIGISQDCAMIHALEIESTFRRQGLARHMTIAAAFWAREKGARFLTLVTTEANAGANALYTSIGMSVVGHYHYRILPE